MKGDRLGAAALLVIFLLSGGGCSKAPEVSYEPGVEAQKPSGKAVDPATAGAISGSVVFEGTPPGAAPIQMEGNPECSALHGETVPGEDMLVSNGRVQNAFVYIKQGLEGYAFEPPAEPVVIDQKGCLYLPHVVGAQVNQTVELLNSDPTLHNIHAFGSINPAWNVGLPFQGMKIDRKFSRPEVMVKLKCDVHPWMLAFVGVLDHPYFAVTGSDGSFEFKNVPPGNFVVEAWHERLGSCRVAVGLAAQETQHISLTYGT